MPKDTRRTQAQGQVSHQVFRAMFGLTGTVPSVAQRLPLGGRRHVRSSRAGSLQVCRTWCPLFLRAADRISATPRCHYTNYLQNAGRSLKLWNDKCESRRKEVRACVRSAIHVSRSECMSSLSFSF